MQCRRSTTPLFRIWPVMAVARSRALSLASIWFGAVTVRAGHACYLAPHLSCEFVPKLCDLQLCCPENHPKPFLCVKRVQLKGFWPKVKERVWKLDIYFGRKPKGTKRPLKDPKEAQTGCFSSFSQNKPQNVAKIVSKGTKRKLFLVKIVPFGRNSPSAKMPIFAETFCYLLKPKFLAKN